MFLRGLPFATLVWAVLTAAAPSTQRGAGPLAHTEPGGTWNKPWSKGEVRTNNYRLGHGQRCRNRRYWERMVDDEEARNDWRATRKQVRTPTEGWKKERRDEDWTRQGREKREGRRNPMELAWGRIVERTEEEAKRSIADEEERRGGMFGREEETRRNAQRRMEGMRGRKEIMVERETEEDGRAMIKRMGYEPKGIRERMKEDIEESRLTHKDSDREKRQMETSTDELRREGIRGRRISERLVNKRPAGTDTFIYKRDNRKRMNVAAEKKEDTLWRDRMGRRGRWREHRPKRLNKTPINNKIDDKFIQRANGESANVDARERAGGETLTKVGIRGKQVKGVQGDSDERKESVKGVEPRMRRNKRERRGISQRREQGMLETNAGNRQILQREERENNELRIGIKREKENEKGRQSDRKEEERKERDELPGRKLERWEIPGKKTEMEKEATRKKENTANEKDETEKWEYEKDIEEERKDVLREKDKPLDKIEKEERLREEEKNIDELNKEEAGEYEKEMNTMKKASDQAEGNKNGSRTANVKEKNQTGKIENNTKDVDYNMKKERVIEKTAKEKNETNKEEETGEKIKSEEKTEPERIIKKKEQGNETDKQEGNITKQTEMKEDKEVNKTENENGNTKTRGATSMEKPDKENTRGLRKRGEGREGGGREEEAAAVFFLGALKEKGKEKNASEKLLTMQGVKGKQANAINMSNNEGAKEKTPDKLWNMTKERSGESTNYFTPAETKDEENKDGKENKMRWNETMDRSTSKRHKRSNNEKENDEKVRELMVLKEMKRALEKQIKRKEKQAESKREKEKKESGFVKFGKGGRDNNKILDKEQTEKNKKKEEEQKLSQKQNVALKKELAHLLREKRAQAREKNKKKEEEEKEKQNSKIKPRRYNIERNLKNWIGDEKIDGMEKKEGKEEKRKKRKMMQERIGKDTFKFLTEAGKVEGKEKAGEGNFSASVVKSDILKALNVSVANRTWEDVKREIKEKEKERKLNKKLKKEAEQRKEETEIMLSGVGIKANDNKENKDENLKVEGGITDERRAAGNKSDDEKSAQSGEKNMNKTANDTKTEDRQTTKEGQGGKVTKGNKTKDATQTQARNWTEEEEQGAARHLLPPELVLTHNSSSPKYLLPTWECALSLFGVKANSYVMIRFQGQGEEEASITLHLQREWTPEEVMRAGILERDAAGPGNVGETVLEVSGPYGGVDVVAREAVVLRADAWTFFSVFRKDRVFAVFRAGQQLPLLVYVVPSTATPFIPDLRLVQVWSKGDAEWDLLGDKYRGENNGREPKDPAIRRELTEMRDGLTSRLGVAAVLQEHGWRAEDDDPRLMKYKRLRESLATLRPLKTLLQYYGRVGSINDSWHDEDRVRRFVATRNIDSVLH